MSADDDTTSHCAACGEGGDGLKKCTACKMVKYCSVQCQKDHRPKHKKECKKRAAELFEEKLFKDPPPREECPICFLPLPINDAQITYQICCGKIICDGCVMAAETEEGWAPCPFCREEPTDYGDYEELVRRFTKRMEANDPKAFFHLGNCYHYGELGLQQDSNKAIELWLKGAELGSTECYSALGTAYYNGTGVEKDVNKSVHYFQLAAMGGCVISRYNLGVDEENAGNTDRALKHWMIAARAGHDTSLKALRDRYVKGYITKDDFANALRAHQKSVDGMKSDNRDRALLEDE